jgi:hypothetical protein
MERMGPLIGVIGLLFVLVGLLYMMQIRRTVVIPEGFTTEYPTEIDMSTVTNPISKIMKKISTLSLHFANPTVWKEAIETSKHSFTDLARRQIEKDRQSKPDKIAKGD